MEMDSEINLATLHEMLVLCNNVHKLISHKNCVTALHMWIYFHLKSFYIHKILCLRMKRIKENQNVEKNNTW